MQRRDLLRTSLLAVVVGASASVARALNAGISGGSDAGDFTSPMNLAFTDSQRQGVAVLSDMIIPATDTPGAVEAGVPGFIETIVADWYTDTEREIFMAGLDELDVYCRRQDNTLFYAAAEDYQLAALLEAEQAAKAHTAHVPSGSLTDMGRFVDEAAPFFTKLKELVVLGYYTSEIGATQELAYNPVPGRFDGDYPLEKVGRQWAF